MGGPGQKLPGKRRLGSKRGLLEGVANELYPLSTLVLNDVSGERAWKLGLNISEWARIPSSILPNRPFGVWAMRVLILGSRNFFCDFFLGPYIRIKCFQAIIR